MSEKTIDLTPNWENVMRILVECIAANPDESRSAKEEIIRGGKILDQLIADRKEATEEADSNG